jgi:LytS/YehU family sensor histidine kinase
MCWSGLYYGSVYFKLNEAELANSHRAMLETQAAKTREQELLATTRDAQLRILRYQLNPHFLYNTLNAINALVQLDNGEKAQNMIQQLSTFLRHSLEDDSIERVQSRQEIENTMLFLAIEKAGFEDALKIEVDITDGAKEAMLPGLILQPLIENVVKHAIAESELGGTVRVSAADVGERLHITVSDSGPGARAKRATNRQGIGLRNVWDRLASHYDENFTLEIENDVSGGSTVFIAIPYEIMIGNSTCAIAVKTIGQRVYSSGTAHHHCRR